MFNAVQIDGCRSESCKKVAQTNQLGLRIFYRSFRFFIRLLFQGKLPLACVLFNRTIQLSDFFRTRGNFSFRFRNPAQNFFRARFVHVALRPCAFQIRQIFVDNIQLPLVGFTFRTQSPFRRVQPLHRFVRAVLPRAAATQKGKQAIFNIVGHTLHLYFPLGNIHATAVRIRVHAKQLFAEQFRAVAEIKALHIVPVEHPRRIVGRRFPERPLHTVFFVLIYKGQATAVRAVVPRHIFRAVVVFYRLISARVLTVQHTTKKIGKRGFSPAVIFLDNR